jgi:hypothetical protein
MLTQKVALHKSTQANPLSEYLSKSSLNKSIVVTGVVFILLVVLLTAQASQGVERRTTMGRRINEGAGALC